MYLYETYHNPIQMISGDAYSALETIPEGAGMMGGRVWKPNPKLDKAIQRYLSTKGAEYVAKKVGVTRRRVNYRAIRLGYKFVGSHKTGHWEAPKEEGND